jgi:hypothetical protein
VALTDITGRAAPLAQSLMEDDEVKRRFRSAAKSGAGAVRAALGKSKEPTRLSAIERAGVALREAGRALTALGGGAERRRKKQQKRRSVGPVAVLAGGLAASAAVLSLRSSQNDTPKEDTHG